MSAVYNEPLWLNSTPPVCYISVHDTCISLTFPTTLLKNIGTLTPQCLACRSDPVIKLSPHSSDVTVSRMSKSTPHPGVGSAVLPPLASSSGASLPGSVLEPLRPAPTSKLNIGAMKNRYENITDTGSKTVVPLSRDQLCG